MAAATQMTTLRSPALANRMAFKSGVKAPTSRTSLVIQANRRVQKKVQVIVTTNATQLGKLGELKTVKSGYFRNWLEPQGLAAKATTAILDQIRAEKEKEVQKKLEEKAKAQAFADALAAIGKVVIKKKAGDNEKIFGSVPVSEVADALSVLTGRKLPLKDITVPEVKMLGNYECTVKLHPEVVGVFTLSVIKEKDIKITFQADKKAARK